MNDVFIARALHVVAVVIWIGGVAMATTVALPAIRRGELGPDRIKIFHLIEHRFIWQARLAVIVVGATGAYMIYRLDLLSRFSSVRFWWMHAMVGVWTLFVALLFIVEPFILQRHFHKWAEKAPDIAFAWLHRLHYILLALALITIFGAVAGSQGWTMF